MISRRQNAETLKAETNLGVQEPFLLQEATKGTEVEGKRQKTTDY
jgi:hypothetical protein